MMKIDIAGEDEVTVAVIRRLVNDLSPDIIIDKTLPARGGQLKSLAPRYNNLNSHILLLTDLDVYDCPPSLLKDWFKGVPLNSKYLFRIAYGEAESWLMADREGFSKWIGADISFIPNPQLIDRIKKIRELVFPYKPSLYLMLVLASQSKNISLKENLTPRAGSKKGPAYNSSLLPFIRNHWDINTASDNSTSLYKAIQRIKNF